MSTSDNWSMLSQYLSGECTDYEKRQIETRIAVEPELRKMLQFMQRVWDTSEVQQPSDVEKLWNQVAEKTGIKMPTGKSVATMPQHKLSKRRYADNYYRIMRYAAAILVVFTLGYFLNGSGLFWGSGELMTITVQNGEREEVTLSDGTHIILDSGSSLRYPKSFDGERREVFLNGEGYFEVARNTDKPFFVQANHGVVQVLGTKFNVRAWRSNRNVAVTVTEGKVSLNSESGPNLAASILTKDQFSELAANGKPTSPQMVDVAQYMAWMHNEVFFDDASLQEILFQLERWYDVAFILEDKILAEERLNLHIKNDSIEDVLKLIAVLTDAKYSRSGQTIRLKL